LDEFEYSSGWLKNMAARGRVGIKPGFYSIDQPGRVILGKPGFYWAIVGNTG
jgi:hypothetical protein